MLPKIKNAEFLGRWRVSEYLKNNDADSLAVGRKEVRRNEDTIFIRFGSS